MPVIPASEAVRAALEELAPIRLERVWEGMGSDVGNFRHESFIVDCRRRVVMASATEVWARLMHMGRGNPWPYADALWRLRGWIDAQISPRGRRAEAKPGASDPPSVGDMLDYYRVEALEPGRLLGLRSTLRAPGDGWMEWRLEEQAPRAVLLTQTAFFAPCGLPGFLYWFALGPLHRFVFRGMIRNQSGNRGWMKIV